MPEVLCAIVLTMVLAAVLVARILNRTESQRAQCLVHLRETSLAFRVFANDHADRFPAQVLARRANSDTAVAVQVPPLIQALDGVLQDTRHLICPADNRTAAKRLHALQATNVSYFLAIDAQDDQPGSVLLGDRLVVRDGTGESLRGQSAIAPGADSVTWSPAAHRARSNLAFADGSVGTISADDLQAALLGRGTGPVRLLFPQ